MKRLKRITIVYILFRWNWISCCHIITNFTVNLICYIWKKYNILLDIIPQLYITFIIFVSNIHQFAPSTFLHVQSTTRLFHWSLHQIFSKSHNKYIFFLSFNKIAYLVSWILHYTVVTVCSRATRTLKLQLIFNSIFSLNYYNSFRKLHVSILSIPVQISIIR